MHASSIQSEVLAGRLSSPVSAKAVLDASSKLIGAMPVSFAVEPDVYAGLQRLAYEVESVIAGADTVRAERHGEGASG